MTPEQIIRIRTAAKELEAAMNDCDAKTDFTVTHSFSSWHYLGSSKEGQMSHRIGVEANVRKVIT